MTPSNLTPQLAMQAQQQSPFLRKIPPELRNRIYAYVFDGSPHTARIEMNDAAKCAPQIDLALTCQRIHTEAAALHTESYSKFWSNNTFALPDNLVYDNVGVTSKHINAMNHITFKMGFLPLTALDLTPIHPFPTNDYCWKISLSVSLGQSDALHLQFVRSMVRTFNHYFDRRFCVKIGQGFTERYTVVRATKSQVKKCDLDVMLGCLRRFSSIGTNSEVSDETDDDQSD